MGSEKHDAAGHADGGLSADERERRVTEAGNPAKPQGTYGAQMLERMNRSHAAVTNWALDHVTFEPGWQVLDIGCGGGATMARIAARQAARAASAGAEGAADVPRTGRVVGVDYSPTSCAQSRAFNAQAIGRGEMDVVEGSVEQLPFADGAFDAATTVESFYFWPSPGDNLREVARVLRPGGQFLLVADVYRHEGLDAGTLANIGEYHLTVLTPEEYLALFLRAGFSSCEVHLKGGTDWICVQGTR